MSMTVCVLSRNALEFRATAKHATVVAFESAESFDLGRVTTIKRWKKVCWEG
jgi:hypothetical protein